MSGAGAATADFQQVCCLLQGPTRVLPLRSPSLQWRSGYWAAAGQLWSSSRVVRQAAQSAHPGRNSVHRLQSRFCRSQTWILSILRGVSASGTPWQLLLSRSLSVGLRRGREAEACTSLHHLFSINDILLLHLRRRLCSSFPYFSI